MGDLFDKYTLFARPCFLSGMARVLDLSGSLSQYNYSPTPEQADLNALCSDWVAVENDLREAIKKFKKSSNLE